MLRLRRKHVKIWKLILVYYMYIEFFAKHHLTMERFYFLCSRVQYVVFLAYRCNLSLSLEFFLVVLNNNAHFHLNNDALY